MHLRVGAKRLERHEFPVPVHVAQGDLGVGDQVQQKLRPGLPVVVEILQELHFLCRRGQATAVGEELHRVGGLHLHEGAVERAVVHPANTAWRPMRRSSRPPRFFRLEIGVEKPEARIVVVRDARPGFERAGEVGGSLQIRVESEAGAADVKLDVLVPPHVRGGGAILCLTLPAVQRRGQPPVDELGVQQPSGAHQQDAEPENESTGHSSVPVLMMDGNRMAKCWTLDAETARERYASLGRMEEARGRLVPIEKMEIWVLESICAVFDRYRVHHPMGESIFPARSRAVQGR